MKTLRKLVTVFLLVVTVVNSPALNIYAQEVNKDVSFHGLGCEPEFIQPYVESPCPYGRYHYMVTKGWGWAYYGEYPDTSQPICSGCCYQCKNCKIVFVSEGDPYVGQSIGTYATVASQEDCTSYNYIWTKSYGYTSNSYLSGFQFFIQ
ncbi:MAG TPA: hypothetical protein GXZ28_00285 [Clostridiales bacterium]|nr:hypothetical protein [Clostridiales bacterium]